MIYNQHSNIKGTHAFLSPSKHSWIRYSEDKLIQTYKNSMAVQRGTLMHAVANVLISLRIKLPRTKATFNMYVNDAIGYHMQPEQPLYYSEFCYGTADAIYYDERKKFLRIHDLKTGVSPVHMEQLEIYAALFYLEYGKEVGYTPTDDNTELRIYQLDDVLVHVPSANDILAIADKIVEFTNILGNTKDEGDNPDYAGVLELVENLDIVPKI